MKNKWMITWRIIVAIGMLAITAFVTVLLYKLYEESSWASKSEEYTESQRHSDSYVLAYKNDHVRTKDAVTGKYLSPQMTHLFHDGAIKDTLTVFRQGESRGFLNVYTGKIEIPAQYERAWIFSEGLGGVVKNGKVGFIDHKGNIVIPYRFTYLRDYKNEVDFVFKRGYCTVIGENNKHGLIDKNGKWVIEPAYDYINKPVKGYRIVEKDDHYGLMDSTLTMTLPIEYDWIVINKEGLLVARDQEQYLLAFEGKTVLQPFVIDSTEELWYSTDQQNAAGEYTLRLSNYCVYKNFNGCGLFDTKNNRVITKAIFSDIKAINNNLFECTLKWPNDGSVLINAKGEFVK